jgi:hypothetical protein
VCLFFCLADTLAEALKSAWRDNYHGENHKLLFANINRIPRTQKAYSNQIAIVQSSGTVKSRMVHEQANLVFTIPFNLRESGDSKGAHPCPVDLFTSDAENQTLPFPSPTMLSAIILLLEHIPPIHRH